MMKQMKNATLLSDSRKSDIYNVDIQVLVRKKTWWKKQDNSNNSGIPSRVKRIGVKVGEAEQGMSLVTYNHLLTITTLSLF